MQKKKIETEENVSTFGKKKSLHIQVMHWQKRAYREHPFSLLRIPQQQLETFYNN